MFSRQRSPRKSVPLWTMSDFIDIAIIIAAIAVVSLGWATIASAQDSPLDLSILSRLDTPTAAPTQAGSTLNLSILDRLDTPTATATIPADTLDITLLNALDSDPGKPAIKPSKAALRSLGTASGVELGDEIGREACKPQASAGGNVNLRDATINPPNGRIWERPDDAKQALIEHLIGHPNHSPKGFTFGILNQLDLPTLERLHSNDHDHRLNLSTRTIAEAPRQSAATNATGAGAVNDSPRSAGTKPTTASTSPPTWGGTRFYWPSRGAWLDSPEPGANYPTMGGILVPLGAGTVVHAVGKTQPWNVMERLRGNCPGGFCPVR